MRRISFSHTIDILSIAFRAIRSGRFTTWRLFFSYFLAIAGYFLVAIVLMISVTSCGTPQYLYKNELVSYIEDESNGVSQTITTKELVVKVSYNPNDIMILEQLEVTDELSVSELRELHDEYVYFLMKLQKTEPEIMHGAGLVEPFTGRSGEELLLDLNKYVSLVTSSNDTITVEDFYPWMMLSSSAETELLFIFKKEKMRNVQSISFNIKEFGFETGDLSFPFDLQRIKELPKLKELKLRETKSASRKALRRSVFVGSI